MFAPGRLDGAVSPNATTTLKNSETDPVGHRRDKRTGRDGENPCPDNVARNPPSNGACITRGANANDGTSNGVRGGHGNPESGRQEQGQRAAGLRAKATNRL